MKILLRAYLIALSSLYLTGLVIESFKYQGGITTLIFGAAVLMLINWFLKPVAKIIMLPFNILTLGLFSWVVNVLMLLILTKIVPQIQIKEWYFPGFSVEGYTIPGYQLNYLLTLIAVSFMLMLISGILRWISK